MHLLLLLLLLFACLLSIPKFIDQQRQSAWTKSSQWLPKLGLIWSCGCYLHETVRTAPLTMKWLEEGGKKDEKNKQNLNDSLLSSYFCTCFPGWPVYIFIREFSTLLKVLGVFQDVCEKWKVCNGRWRGKKTQQIPCLCSCNVFCNYCNVVANVGLCLAAPSLCLYFIQEGCSTIFWVFPRFSS